METNIRIFPATSSHISSLSELARQTFTETFGPLYTPEDLAAHLRKDCSEGFFAKALAESTPLLLAQDGATLVGYAKYGVVGLPVDHDPMDGEIHRLYVRASHQGRGIGAQLMEAVLASPRMRSAPNLYLGVWEENHKAQRFYARYGFTSFSEHIFHVGSHADRDLILRRRQETAA